MAVPLYILVSNACDFQPRHILISTWYNLFNVNHSDGGADSHWFQLVGHEEKRTR